MLDQTANFIKEAVSGAHDNAVTVINVLDASAFPDPLNGEYNLTWYDSTNFPDPSDDLNVEIVRVTGRDTGANTLTVTRAQEGTLATTKNTAGATYMLMLAPTKKMMDDIEEALGSTGEAAFVSNEVPSGLINSSNAVFTTAHDFIATKIAVYLNRTRLKLTEDYTETGPNEITLNIAPTTGDDLWVDYVRSDSVSVGDTSYRKTNEEPTGLVNGSNTVFTTAEPFISGSAEVFLNGLKQDVTTHYTESGASEITFVTAPQTGDSVRISYQTNLTPAGNADTLDGAHLESIASGWFSVADSWAYASADTPTFVITVPSGASSKYSPGMRIKLTQTTVKYFIITAVSDTTLTVYGGTDYTLANAAISEIYYSTQKAPLGFPLDVDIWTVSVQNTTQTLIANPVQNTYYNINSFSISIPIGKWITYYRVYGFNQRASSGSCAIHTTLSTSNNGETDGRFTAVAQTTVAYSTSITGTDLAMTLQSENSLVLSSKTTYYLNTKTNQLGTTNIGNINGQSPAIIRAVCAYL